MLAKNDFVELEFTGKVKEGDIFDTNLKEEAKKLNLEMEERPLIICLGQNMILPSIDDFLIGKEIGKYTLELEPEKAFGTRTPSLVKTMPTKVFYDQKINPQAGMVFNFDGMIGKITVVSGGRVIVDFNHPLSNKTVIYELNVKRKVEDEKEKARVLIEFMFKRKLNFEIKDKKVIIEIENKFQPIIAFFSEKFKEIIGLELDTKQEVKKDSEVPTESNNPPEHVHGPDCNHEHEKTPKETPVEPPETQTTPQTPKETPNQAEINANPA